MICCVLIASVVCCVMTADCCSLCLVRRLLAVCFFVGYVFVVDCRLLCDVCVCLPCVDCCLLCVVVCWRLPVVCRCLL